MEAEYDRNTTNYKCQDVKCQCIPISDFLTEEIKGPATFSTTSSDSGKNDGSTFKEPAMDDLIKSIFGDESITLQCHSGECLYRTDVPGYQRPVKQINTPLIAGVIAAGNNANEIFIENGRFHGEKIASALNNVKSESLI